MFRSFQFDIPQFFRNNKILKEFHIFQTEYYIYIEIIKYIYINEF